MRFGWRSWISARFNAEQALFEAKRELEQKVRDRTAELARMVEELRVRSQQCQGLTNQLIQTGHRERRRIAQVLHDAGVRKRALNASESMCSAV
jgi:signal transduction histidine kinase